MRELEFLPDWYPQLRKRNRLVALQGYMTLLLVAGLGFAMYLVRRNVTEARASVVQVSALRSQSSNELKQLDEQQRLLNELVQRQQIHAKLGTSVEMSRLLQTIDKLMPREMSLTDVAVETTETSAPVTSVAAARQLATQKGASVDRKLGVKLLAVGPTDVDLANFLTDLAKVSFFDNVAWTFARDRINGGYVMREYEITFSMNLNGADR